MPVLFYILKLSVCLTIVWLFYQLVLRRLTFYTWNRWYLVVFTALAFLLPLIDISPVLEKNNWTQVRIVPAIPQLPAYTNMEAAPSFPEQLISWLPFVVAAGAAIMLTRLLLQYFSLLSMRRSSTLLLNGRVKVYQVDKPVIPFSFGNAIFLNQHLHDQEELKEIIRHEFIHVKQRHTIDIIWSEAICILTWYNPFSWLIKKAIRQNLEFIADQQVLKTGLDRKEYQYLLLKVIGVPSFSIASNFNFKSLKKRIAMMNKVKSARVHLVRFLLLLPVAAFILLAFRNAAQNRQQPLRNVFLTDTLSPKKSWPENVESFRSVNNQVTVTLKDGKLEKYNLNNAEELAAFEKKYGKIPEPPVPPIAPDAPDAPLALTDVAELVEMPLEAPLAPLPPQDDCYNNKGYCISVIDTRNGQMVLVQKKNSKETELVYLSDWNKNKKYGEKYGELPPPPPPLPPAPPADLILHEVPADVSSIHTKDYDVHIVKEDGTQEHYDLRLSSDKSKYEKKYGIKEVPRIVKVRGVAPDGAPQGQVEMIVETPSKATPETVETVTLRADEIYIQDPTSATGRAYNVELDGKEVLAVINKSMQSQKLEQVKSQLAAKGVDFQIKDMKIVDGIIMMVSAKMTADKKTSNIYAHDFEQIVISRVAEKQGDKTVHVHLVNITTKAKQ